MAVELDMRDKSAGKLKEWTYSIYRILSLII